MYPVSHCLKIIKNVAFEFLNYGIVHQFFFQLKLTTKNSPNWLFFSKTEIICNFGHILLIWTSFFFWKLVLLYAFPRTYKRSLARLVLDAHLF